MPEITVPCPNCQTSLLVDEQNAGHDVLCPECQVRLTLPRDLSGAVLPVMKDAPAADGLAVRKNHPLYRTGHLTALPAEPDPAAGPPPPRAAHLPERRGLTPEEEMRRLAALTVEPPAYDLHNVDTKGRTAFPCPGCHRPVWIARTEWGLTKVCDGCAREVVAPDPSKGEPARLNPEAPPEPRQKTVLPGRRQVENLAVGEQPAVGRPKRQGGQLPPARESASEPMLQTADRARSRPPHIEPIPARGDVDMAAPVRKGPPAGKRVVTPTQEQAAAAAGFEDHDTAQGIGPVEVPQVRLHHRINPERAPNFTPKHEADLSVETTGNWGGEAPQENSLAFRRILTIAIITLLLGAIAVTAFLLRATWARPDLAPENGEAPESPVQSVEVAKATMARFFNAVTVEDRAREVRHPEITLPRMRSWYARNNRTQHIVEYTDDWREQDNYAGKGINFIFTTVRLDSLNDYDIFLEISKDGSATKIDWEHFTGWSETTWIEFLKATSIQPGEFRVTITPTDYYNGYFSDRSRYLAFTVKDRDNSGSCTAYCEAGTNLGNLLLKGIREARKLNTVNSVNEVTGEGIARVILRLRYLPEGQKFNQATIDALVWDDWLEP